MEKRVLGNSGIEVSVIAYGAWGIGGAPFWSDVPKEDAISSITAALDHGVNLIDTAPVYGFGRSEITVGKALTGRRDKAVIATKCGLRWKNESLGGIYRDAKPASIREELEASLKRLGTDYIDLYQVHWPDTATPFEDTAEELEKIRAEGKIRAWGVSNYSVDQLEKSPGAVSVQPQYNLLERSIESDLLPYCRERGIAVLPYSPLASGLLTGKYGKDSKFADWRGKHNFGLFDRKVFAEAIRKTELLKSIADKSGMPLAHMAISWLIFRPGVSSVLVGVKNAQQMVDNVRAAQAAIPAEIAEEIERVTGGK